VHPRHPNRTPRRHRPAGPDGVPSPAPPPAQTAPGAWRSGRAQTPPAGASEWLGARERVGCGAGGQAWRIRVGEGGSSSLPICQPRCCPQSGRQQRQQQQQRPQLPEAALAAAAAAAAHLFLPADGLAEGGRRAASVQYAGRHLVDVLHQHLQGRAGRQWEARPGQAGRVGVRVRKQALCGRTPPQSMCCTSTRRGEESRAAKQTGGRQGRKGQSASLEGQREGLGRQQSQAAGGRINQAGAV
jgi:hypothetical protein